ncbi:cation diffusion facilitator family transporter [Lacticaseibacillus camelliae]|uniref:Co Zn Cd efflux system component n=1 Tax=Lacticaseibacillus camelliae DSM 22697 = JCM 13995 TaxID=1423730 RepID=A0A0R2FID1_9LACO|nr:cation diffusion facilitator family transporter [Lacticaseibacillus camelliae]KRN25925.1 Co Zn Cd efflux system component [Lacticaseibacillus camelliae DSM 22697 = JCM 13995]
MTQPKPNHAFRWGIFFNSLYIIAEVGFGLAIGSIALVADALHNLSDVLGLCIAWFASWLTLLKPTSQRTYGYKSSSIMAALLNAVFLLIAMGAIIVEALQRLATPEPTKGGIVMLIAGVGILVNGATAMLFHAGQQRDLNIRGAFMHMAADAGVSLGVVIAGGMYLLTGWEWLDPVVSILVALVVLVGTWGLLKDAVNLAMAAVPKAIDTEKVRALINAYPTVASCHDLHIWALSTTDVALTVHITRKTDVNNDQFLEELGHKLRHTFDIAHVTIQVEYGDYLPLQAGDNPY